MKTIVLISLFSVALASPFTYDATSGVKGRRMYKKVFEDQTPSEMPKVTESDVSEVPQEVKTVSNLCMEGIMAVPSDEGYSTIVEMSPCKKESSEESVENSSETTQSNSDESVQQEDQTDIPDSYTNIKTENDDKVELEPPALDSDEERALSRDLQPPKVDPAWSIMKDVPESSSESDEIPSSTSRPRGFVKGVKSFNRWRPNSSNN